MAGVSVDLPSDLWCVIGSKLDTPSDRLRFRAVSKTWKSLLPFRQPPWLMLAESQPNNNTDDDDDPPRRGFVCLGEQKVNQIDFLEIHKARCVGSTGNWLATMYLDKTICLLNPFSRLKFHLPSVLTFEHQFYIDPDDQEGLAPELYRDQFVWKIVLSSPPDAGDCIAVALHYYKKVLAFATPGDPSWTTLQVAGLPDLGVLGVRDMIFYNKKLYAITFRARLMVCDIHADAPQLTYLTQTFTQEGSSQEEVKYLVECSGELLLVVKFVDIITHDVEQIEDDFLAYKTNRFQVYKLDFTAMKFTQLESLGEYSLFLGFNTSVSLRAADYYGLLRRNCIYFTDDYCYGYCGTGTAGGHDMGVFDLEDNSITPHFKGLSTSLYSPPVWIVPA